MIRALVLLAPLLPAAAAAGPVEDWERLHDTLLLESAYGDTRAAVTVYQQLVGELPAGDPLRPEALYWLGHARYVLGETETARDALREGVRTGCPRHLCLELLGRIELEESSIRELPVRWTFADSAHGVVHPWRYHDTGSVRVREEGPAGDPALVWTTVVDVRSENQLVIGFDHPQPAPHVLRFRARATEFPAWVRVVAVDVDGQRFSLAEEPGALLAPVGNWKTHEIRLDGMQGLDRSRDRLVPARIDKLLVQDVTAYYIDGRTGRNHEIWLDDLEVE